MIATSTDKPSPGMETPETALPLSDVRILDLTQVLSGPFCTQLLADMGAEVIKVEGPQGDVARELLPQRMGEDSVYYLSINRNKYSLVVDLKTRKGIDLVRRLARSADIVIENFRPGVCERLGLGAAELRSEKPSLIWCSISGFGQGGPYRDKPAYDMVVQALAGGMSLTGAKDGNTVRAGIPVADLSAGLYASSAILAALHRRSRTGRGETIDISMMDCQVAMLTYQAAAYLHSGRVPGRQGREHDGIATYGTFKAADGIEVVVAAITERMWLDLCRAMGKEELALDRRFITAEARLENRKEITRIIEDGFLARTADEWMRLLDQKGIPAGIVNTLDRVMQDPQVSHRNMIIELKDGNHCARVIGDPVKFSETQPQEPRYPPPAGRDTVEVLRRSGLGEEEIAALIEQGVVGIHESEKSGTKPSGD